MISVWVKSDSTNQPVWNREGLCQQLNTCPARFPKITVLYTVTNGRGNYDVKLCIVHAASGETILDAPDVIQMDSPLTIGDTQATLHDVPLPPPGKYWVEIRANDELIGQRPFYVSLIGPRPAQPG